jgi:branched-subunit amino acid aminotransferase/4-amino-4-deoxychorismate lyase
MAPKRASKQQQQLNVDQFKLLKTPMDHLGKQINVPGSFWEGRMLPDERAKVYKCTIVDFSLAHKFAPDSSPRKAFKMQDGRVSIFRVDKHYNRFLKSLERMCMPAIPEDIFKEGLKKLVSIEHQAPTTDGRWFLVRIMPYRTMEKMIDGVVITCNDITVAKTVEETLRKEIDRLNGQISS